MSKRSVLRLTRTGLGLVAVAGVLAVSAMSSVQAQQYPPASVPPSIVPPASIVPSVVPSPPAPAVAAPTTVAPTTVAPTKAPEPVKIPAEVLSVTVKPAPAATVEAANIAASQPAYTGANSTGLALVGAGLFAGGAVLVVATRRRRTPTTA
jgi:LPXTG-motif cell wall-anchored protein